MPLVYIAGPVVLSYCFGKKYGLVGVYVNFEHCSVIMVNSLSRDRNIKLRISRIMALQYKAKGEDATMN